MASDASQGWDPQQYERFREQRAQPFYDLAAMVEPRPGMRVVDLGSGTGELTAWLHRELGASETLGVDRSQAMLEAAAAHAGRGVRFQQAEVEAFLDGAKAEPGWDLVFSNAALHWIPDHEALWPRLASIVAPGGQFAVQIPAQYDHISHRTAHEVACEEPFADALAGYVREDPVQQPEWYAETLHALGFEEPRVELRVYPHLLPDADAVVEWVKGSLLTDYQRRLPAATYAAYLERYRETVVERLGDARPLFYGFKRLLMWGRRSAAAS
jgi:trans-aconitate 2-methyltransferase